MPKAGGPVCKLCQHDLACSLYFTSKLLADLWVVFEAGSYADGLSPIVQGSCIFEVLLRNCLEFLPCITYTHNSMRVISARILLLA